MLILTATLFAFGYLYKGLYVAVHGFYEGDDPPGSLFPFSNWHVTRQNFGNYDFGTFFGGALIIAIFGIIVIPIIKCSSMSNANRGLSTTSRSDNGHSHSGCYPGFYFWPYPATHHSGGGDNGCGRDGGEACLIFGLVILCLVVAFGVFIVYYELLKIVYRESERFYASAAEYILEVKDN